MLPKLQNRLLQKLRPDDLLAMQPHLEHADFKVGEILTRPGQSIEQVYFIESGVCSVIATGGFGHGIELAEIGVEGLVGLPVILGQDVAVNLVEVRKFVLALRVPAEALQGLMERSPSARKLLLSYVHTGIVQLTSLALANARLSIPSRLSRLLLMFSDRANEQTLALTHEAIAEMLGVRRSGITTALHVLEGERMVRCVRGRITVLDRERLILAAKGGFGDPEAEYARTIGPA